MQGSGTPRLKAAADKNGNSVAFLGLMAARNVGPSWTDQTFHSLSAWCLEAGQITEFLNKLCGRDEGIASRGRC